MPFFITPQVVGQLHNDGLEFIYQRLNQMPRRTILSNSQEASVVLETLNAGIDYFEKTFAEPKTQKLAFQNQFRRTFDFFYDPNATTNTFLDFQNSQVIASSSAKNYYNQLINNSKNVTDSNAYTTLITNLFNTISNDATVDLEEKYNLLISCQVGISSMAYWQLNILKWNKLFSDSQGSVNWGGVGGADVGGAVGGGIKYGIGLLFVPSPFTWGAFGGAVIGSALGASVGKLIIDLW